MRLLCVSPGASFATFDVYAGHVDALRRMGHEVITYHLDNRILESGKVLHWMWQAHKKRGGPLADHRPTAADVQYRAGVWVLENYARLLPDWTIVFSGMYFHPNLLLLLRNLGAKVALVLSESPYDDEKQAKIAPLADVCVTNERASVPVLRAANPNTHYLPHAFDPARHHPGVSDMVVRLPSAEYPNGQVTRPHDVVFVGTGFQERIDLLSAVDWTGIDLGLYGSWALLRDIPRRDARGRFAEGRQYPHPLRPFVRSEEIDNKEAVALYKRAKIGINLFRSSKGFGVDAPKIAAGAAESLNPRLLELAACGVFTLSDWRPEVEEVFGEAVPTFSTSAELAAAIRYWLDPEQDIERQDTAAQLSARVKDWTFDAMAARLVAHLQGVVPLNLVPPTEHIPVEQMADAGFEGASGTFKGYWGLPK